MNTFQEDPFGSHSKLIHWVRKGKTVLDLGCSSGYMAEKLFKKNFKVIGVDIDQNAINQARKYCSQVIGGDIEDLEIMKKVLENRYDIILLADVLEHFKDPAGVLKQLGKSISKDGEVIISVPNIAFITYRLLHLLGRFDYEEFGIMDKTHLRFFTRKSIEELIENVGLKITEFDCVGNFTQLPCYMQTIYKIAGKAEWIRRFEYFLTRLWPEGLVVQFLYKCKVR